MFSYESINKKKQDNLPWVEKYRPVKIDNIVSHSMIVRSLKEFIKKKTLPHLLFFGPSGSGKTSTIMCCANEIYGKYIDCIVLHLNASNERGIDVVRRKINYFVRNQNSIFLPIEMRNIFKLVILDEIDSMTVEAQGMLRQTIEKNSATTRFCLICNEIDKINVALQSRCTTFRFPPLKTNDMIIRLNNICTNENIKIDEDTVNSIVKISNGDMRACINILQSVNLTKSHIKGVITKDDVYKVSGYCTDEMVNTIYNILNKLTKTKIKLAKAVDNITNIMEENSITMFNLLAELKDHVIQGKACDENKIYLIDNFAQIEIYDSINFDLKNMVINLCSLFLLLPKN